MSRRGNVDRRALRDSSSTFRPTMLGSTCVLWLRADLGFSGAGWVDQTSSARLFAPGVLPTYVASGINNLPSLAFNGTTTKLLNASIPLTPPLTIYGVGQQTTQAGRAIIGDYASVFTYYLGTNAATSAATKWDTLQVTKPSFTGATSPTIYKGVVNGASSSTSLHPGNLTIGGTLDSTAATGASIGCVHGSTSPSLLWDKWISEVIILATTGATAGDAAVLNYLETRYGIGA